MARNTMIALVLGASMLLFASPGSAGPSGSGKDVFVVNDVAQPVPTAAQGTTHVAGTVDAIPGIPTNLFTLNLRSDGHSFVRAARSVAVTSVTVTNSSEEVRSFLMNGRYESGGCIQGAPPSLAVEVQPHSTTHIHLPVPLVFGEETIQCGHSDPVPVARQGFSVGQTESGRSVLIIGYTS